MVEKLVILGSGPAGLTAAIYGARSYLNPLIIDGKEPGGQLMKTSYVENWPGERSIMGPFLMEQLRNHAVSLNTRFLAEQIISVDFKKKPFELTTNKQNCIRALSIIIATGTTPKKLGCPGEEQFWGKGVSTCAVCDGTFYAGKEVVVVGGGDSAMESASFLTNFTDKVTIIHILDALTACASMQSRILHNPKIRILYASTVTAITGDKKVTSVTVKNQKNGEETIIPTEGVFINIGLNPNTEIFKDHLELTPFRYIALKTATATSVPGIFAAGDVADAKYRQAITSAGTGCAAALDAERFLKEHGL